MKKLWLMAGLLLAAALFLVVLGGWMLQTSRRMDRPPAALEDARSTLERMGGEEGLTRRREILEGMLRDLRARRQALLSDAAALSRRMEQVLAELGLEVTESSRWEAVPAPGEKEATRPVFGRTFSGAGSFTALLDALHTFEEWPDGARLRSLTVETAEPAGVRFTFEIVVARLPREGEPTTRASTRVAETETSP